MNHAPTTSDPMRMTMSDLEDFKLGGRHNAGDPEGRRVMTDKPVAWLVRGPYEFAELHWSRQDAEQASSIPDGTLTPLFAHPPVPVAEPSMSQRMNEAGFTRRDTGPSHLWAQVHGVAEPLGWVHPDDIEGDRPGADHVLVYAHPPVAEPVASEPLLMFTHPEHDGSESVLATRIWHESDGRTSLEGYDSFYFTRTIDEARERRG